MTVFCIVTTVNDKCTTTLNDHKISSTKSNKGLFFLYCRVTSTYTLNNNDK